MIAIIDHEPASSRLLERAFQQVGAPVEVVHSADRVERASKVVVGGTGPFADAIRVLRDRGLVGPIMRAVQEGRPYLGIGVGLHLLMDVSYEHGQHTGMGLVPGKVVGFEVDTQHPVRRQFKPPHAGWTPVRWSGRCPLLRGLHSGCTFFFQHAHHAQPLDEAASAGLANFGVNFTAVLWENTMFGTQFLPERSQESGQKVIENFAGM